MLKLDPGSSVYMKKTDLEECRKVIKSDVIGIVVKHGKRITKTCPCNILRFLKLQKNENFLQKNFDIFLIFPQNIDLCFRAKIRKKGIPLHTPVLLYKSGVYGGIHYTGMFS